jgi:hypothetical protein
MPSNEMAAALVISLDTPVSEPIYSAVILRIFALRINFIRLVAEKKWNYF